jgi:hypothetical protein
VCPVYCCQLLPWSCRPGRELLLGFRWGSVRWACAPVLRGQQAGGCAGILENDSDGMSRADADADGAVTHVAPTQLESQEVSGAGGAKRMPDGDRASIRGEFLVGDDEPVELIGQVYTFAACSCSVFIVSMNGIGP